MQDAADGSESDRELAAVTAPQVRFGDFSAISMLKILVCFVVLDFGFSSKCFVRKSRRQTPPKGGPCGGKFISQAAGRGGVS